MSNEHSAEPQAIKYAEPSYTNSGSTPTIDAARALPVLQNLCAIWGRPVHLQMLLQEEMQLITCTSPEGEARVTEDGPITIQKITDDTPEPAHVVI